MLENLTEIQCPSCFEWFSFTLPHELGQGEVELDYDCEVCCRPMFVIVTAEGATTLGMDD